MVSQVVMLSVAKHLKCRYFRSFAALRMTGIHRGLTRWFVKDEKMKPPRSFDLLIGLLAVGLLAACTEVQTTTAPAPKVAAATPQAYPAVESPTVPVLLADYPVPAPETPFPNWAT